MIGIFRKKSRKEKLEKEYKKLMEQGYKLQSINRVESDKMYQEAQKVLDEIELIKD